MPSPARLRWLFAFCCACTGRGPDTATDPPDDTGEPPAPPIGLGDAEVTFSGTPSSAAGSAVALPGDLDGDGSGDVVVAAFYGNRVCAWSGPVAAGAYSLDDGACVTGAEVYDFVGYAVAPAGDLDGDGRADLLVTAVGSDTAGIEAGEVYVLHGPLAPGPIAAARIRLTGEQAGDYAGSSVAAAGDVDGDGVPDLLVGASGSDVGGGGAGRAYLLRGPFAEGTASLGDAWATFTGTAPTPPAARAHGAATGGDALGDAAAGLGDIDGDGLDDLVIGASGAQEAGQDAGAAWIVRGGFGAGDQGADVRLAGPGPSAYAGGSVAGPGDLDGDGLADVIVGADGWEGGRVYVLFGPLTDGVASLADAPAQLSGPVDADYAGWAVSGAGDTDGDGQRELIVGAPGDDAGGLDGGAAWLVTDPTVAGVRALDEAGSRWRAEAPGDAAGRAVAGGSDVDGDGLDDLLVGALYEQSGGVFAGKAYLLTWVGGR